MDDKSKAQIILLLAAGCFLQFVLSYSTTDSGGGYGNGNGGSTTDGYGSYGNGNNNDYDYGNGNSSGYDYSQYGNSSGYGNQTENGDEGEYGKYPKLHYYIEIKG